MTIPGARPPTPQELVRVADRISFVYVEHALISRQDSAVTLTSERGVIHLPAAQLSCLLIGPGCRVTHHAMMLLAECGTTAAWVGEKGVRFYASGRGLTRSSRMIEAQARLVTNTRTRLDVARRMYELRFPDEDVSHLTMQQLRGREGARVRKIYRREADRTGVTWTRRDYRPDDFDSSDDVNRALSAANSALYGVVHAVVVALGASPALGFVHTGGDLAFVHDVADLYKAETSIPVAFDIAAGTFTDAAAQARRQMRDAMVENHVLERCVTDVRRLLLESVDDDTDADWTKIVALWDGGSGSVSGAVNYGDADLVDW